MRVDSSPDLIATSPELAAFNASPAKHPRLELLTIDVLRGAAAAWVVLYHAHGFFWRVGAPPLAVDHAIASICTLVFGQGFLGVPLFFVLSGFCIHLPYARPGARLDVREYAIRRLVRIWPPYAVAVLLGAALTYLKTRALLATIANATAHLVFWIWGTHPSDGETALLVGLAAAWTVVVEVQLYAIYALLFGWIRRVGIARATMWSVAFGIGYHVLDEVLRGSSHELPGILASRVFAPARFGEWMLGAWLADAVVNRRVALPRSAVTMLVWMALGVAIVVLARVLSIVGHIEMHAADPVFSAGFAIVIGAAVLGEQRAGGSQAERRTLVGHVLAPLATAGKRCYSLYLFHFATIAIVGELFARMRHLTDADKDAMGGTPFWLLTTVVAVLAAIIVAEVVYRVVELPSHRAARRLAQRA